MLVNRDIVADGGGWNEYFDCSECGKVIKIEHWSINGEDYKEIDHKEVKSDVDFCPYCGK